MQITSQKAQRATSERTVVREVPIYPRRRSDIDSPYAWSDDPHHALEECDAIVVTLPLSPADREFVLALYRERRPFSVTVR